MRMACLHLPGFLLQVHVRATPHLQGTAFAVLDDPGKGVARIVTCSRRALENGVRIGMTATQARAAAPGVTLVDAEPTRARAAMQSLGEAILGLSVTVDIEPWTGEHRPPAHVGEVYALVPPSAGGVGGGVRFGERMLQAAALQGFRGRVGIADNRFTAWAATQARRDATTGCRRVARRRSWRPYRWRCCPSNPDVKRTLSLLGVRTLGDFAGLPAPSVGRRWAREGVDYQTLARGGNPTPLAPSCPASRSASPSSSSTKWGSSSRSSSSCGHCSNGWRRGWQAADARPRGWPSRCGVAPAARPGEGSTSSARRGGLP